MPTIDLSRDRTALSGKFLVDELKTGRELELQNILNFQTFELVDELPPRKHAYDVVGVDEWRGGGVRSLTECASVQGRGTPTRHVFHLKAHKACVYSVTMHVQLRARCDAHLALHVAHVTHARCVAILAKAASAFSAKPPASAKWL